MPVTRKSKSSNDEPIADYSRARPNKFAAAVMARPVKIREISVDSDGTESATERQVKLRPPIRSFRLAPDLANQFTTTRQVNAALRKYLKSRGNENLPAKSKKSAFST